MEAKPRRVRSARYPGIYYREGAKGRTWEYVYRDSNGSQRWKCGFAREQDAVADRDELRDKMRRGAVVKPTRRTVSDVSAEWLATRSQLRPRTRDHYEWAFRVWINPALGHLRAQDVTRADLLGLFGAMREADKSENTLHAVFTPLRGMLDYAVSEGFIVQSPVGRLKRGEAPGVADREMRVLNRDEIGRLLEAASSARYRAVLATAIFTGLRLGELLGLTWANVDFEANVLRVRRQLNRKGERVTPKTKKAVRDVVLTPPIARELREHKLRSEFVDDEDFVFVTAARTPLSHRNTVRSALDAAIKRAKIGSADEPRIRFHDLRHTYASLMIGQGMTLPWVSRQLGHSRVSVTADVYAHEFDAAEHAERMSVAIEASFGGMLGGNALSTSGGNQRQNEPAGSEAQVLEMPIAATGGN